MQVKKRRTHGDEKHTKSITISRRLRMLPGHMNYPSKVLWDGARGYIACRCQTHYGTVDGDVLYSWDAKTAATVQETCKKNQNSNTMSNTITSGIASNGLT